MDTYETKKLSRLLNGEQLQCVITPIFEEGTYAFDPNTHDFSFKFNHCENKVKGYLIDFAIFKKGIEGQCLFHLINKHDFNFPEDFYSVKNGNKITKGLLKILQNLNKDYANEKETDYIAYIDYISTSDYFFLQDLTTVLGRLIINYVLKLTEKNTEVIVTNDLIIAK